MEGAITPPRPRAVDDDWYRVAATGKTLALAVTLEGTAAALEIFDRDRNLIAHTAERYVPAVACVEACFVKVSGSTAGPYTLTVAGTDPAADAELEPNDRAVDATPLEPGKPKQGTIYTREDVDWYRVAIEAPQPGQFLRIELKGVENVRPELEVRALQDSALLATVRAPAAGDSLLLRDLSLRLGAAAADAGQIGAADGGSGQIADVDGGAGQIAGGDGGAGQMGDAGAPAGGVVDAGAGAGQMATAGAADGGSVDAGPSAAPMAGYYLVVRSRAGANARVPYSISATLESGPPDLEQEPNDDPQHATPLAGSATGYLAPAFDVDWYRIHLDSPQIARIELSGADRADLELQVGVPDGDKQRVIARANEGGPREPEILPSLGLPAGDSYVLVQSAPRKLEGKWVRDAEDPQNPYKLTVTLAPDDGTNDREPNDDVEHAQKIALPAAAKGYVWPRKDVDLYAFHVDAGHAPISIRLSAVRGVDLMLRLLEVHGTRTDVIGSSDQRHGEGEEQLLSVPLKEGDYAVEVSSPRGKDASATQPYELRVQ